MTDKPNPWNFHNTDHRLISPNKLYKLVYYSLSEIAMGAPLGGSCFLEDNAFTKIKIHDWCGGPPVWDTEGQRFAVPIWTRSLLKGTVQQIGIVDVAVMELVIFAKTFRVLDLHSFDNNIISGLDSPIYRTESVFFDVKQEKIENRISLI